MTSAALQCIAVVTMMIDHIGYKLFPGTAWLRMIGRLAFPIFAFMLVEGFVHTSSRKKYFQRLLFFTIISEIPYKLFTYNRLWLANLKADWLSEPWKNVFFELVLIFLALWCLERGKGDKPLDKLFYLGAIGLVVLAEVLDTMYGAYGVLLAVGFYIFRQRRWAGMLCLVVLTVLQCLYAGYWFQVYAVAAAVPLYFYNGQRGQRLPRYFCYWFYPVHLLVIYALYWQLAPMLYASLS